METVLTLIYQTIIMFLLAGIGFLLFRTGKISEEGSKSLGNILIYVVLPSVIIKGFLVERTSEKMIALGISTAAAVILLLISTLISHLLFRKNAIACFASAFSNPGFFGVPLIVAALSSDAVFYIASFIGMLNLLQWTYGVSIMTGKTGRISMRNLVKAPFFVAIVIGMALFLTAAPVPKMAVSLLTTLSNINTPLAMFTVGVYLAKTDVRKMIAKKDIYLVCISRLILIPAVCILVLMLLPQQYLDLKLALLIAIACPVGSNVAVYAQLHQKDYAYAVETVVMSTLFSIVTIPLVQSIGMYLFQFFS